MRFRMAVDARAIGPSDSQHPKIGQHPANTSGRARIGSTQNRKVAVAASKDAVWEIEPQFDGFRRCLQRSLRPRQRRGTGVDSDDLRAGRLLGQVAAGTDAGIEQPAGKPAEEERTDMAIARVFERPVEQIVKRRYALITVDTADHGGAAFDRHVRIGTGPTPIGGKIY